ncbi:MAG: helix-turn-helix domain-containing protein [Spirochaetes bacterium]|nr:helix-turn-helix domain-containing protein [Spirochaetota bacterium]
MSHEEDLITVEEAARMLRISPRTVSRYRAEGRIPFIRFSPRKMLFRRNDILSFIRSSYREACDYCE